MLKDNSKKQKCGYNNFRRNRYFHGMLMTDSDFSEEQSYHIRKRKLLNRMLHGTGVVCGLKMEPTGCGESSKIIISSGLALDCAGNEIFVPEQCELNIVEMINLATGSENAPVGTRCNSVSAKAPENKWYVVVRYQEVHNAPVQVYAPTGGCEEKVCDYSRIKEGYCFEVLKDIPASVECPKELKTTDGKCKEYLSLLEENGRSFDHFNTKPLEDEKQKVRRFLCEDLLMPCPNICCDNQPVVLGSIDFTEKDITPDTTIDKNMINNWDCRRYVITFGLLQYWMEQFAPAELPFDAIINYALLKDACKDENSAVDFFKQICGINKGASKNNNEE